MLPEDLEKFMPSCSCIGEDGSENTSRLSVLCLSFKMVSFSGEMSGNGDSISCTRDIMRCVGKCLTVLQVRKRQDGDNLVEGVD
jgi:hypothetical protein